MINSLSFLFHGNVFFFFEDQCARNRIFDWQSFFTHLKMSSHCLQAFTVPFFFFFLRFLNFGCTGSFLQHMDGLSLIATSRGYTLLKCMGLSLHLLLQSIGSRLQQLWHTGLVARTHVGSSWTRDQICVPCIGRQILNHQTTRESPVLHSF